MVMELPKVWLRNEQSLKKIISDDDVLVDAAVAEGRGILYLTPHLGCFEITARYLARRGPITVMFRPPRQAMLAPVLEQDRNTSKLKAVPATMPGVRECMSGLQRRKAVYRVTA